MIDSAWGWARARNLWRVNPIHKEEEIKVVVEDFFNYNNETGFETHQRATMEVEDMVVETGVYWGYMCPPYPFFILNSPNHWVPKPCWQDAEGALLEESDLVPEGMARLLPEVKEQDDKSQEEAQPGTGASFKLLL